LKAKVDLKVVTFFRPFSASQDSPAAETQSWANVATCEEYLSGVRSKFMNKKRKI